MHWLLREPAHRYLSPLIAIVACLPAPRLAAQEGSPNPLIGTWVLNVARSTYPGTPPRSITRTFDDTRGLILCTYETVDAAGKTAFNHRYIGLDGKEYPEYWRAAGRQPAVWLSFAAVDAYRTDITVRRPDGTAANVAMTSRRTAKCLR